MNPIRDIPALPSYADQSQNNRQDGWKRAATSEIEQCSPGENMVGACDGHSGPGDRRCTNDKSIKKSRNKDGT